MSALKENEEKDYTTISISTDLAQKIDTAIKKGDYTNRADFTRDAIRRLLEKINQSQETSTKAKQAWCPICGSKLFIIKQDGQNIFNCKLHGKMKTYLDRDPKRGSKI